MRFRPLVGLVLVFAFGIAFPHAQDRLFLFDREISTQAGQFGNLVGPAPRFGDDSALFGGRFIARLQWDPALGDDVRYLLVTDARTGGELPFTSLTVPATLPMPVLVADPSRLRVFAWYGQTVAAVDASTLAWRAIVTAAPAEISVLQGRARAIGYASGIDALVLVRASMTGGAEIVWVQASTGVVTQSVALPRAWTALAVTADGARAFGLAERPGGAFGHVLHAVDRVTGQVMTFDDPGIIDAASSLTLDEVTGRLITRGSSPTSTGSLIGFDLDLAHRWTLAIPGAQGETFAVNRAGQGFVVPYVAPQALPLHRFDVASGTIRETVDVTARAGLRPGNYLLMILSPPRAPTGLTASVAGRDVGLTWHRTDDATSYVLDAWQGNPRVHVYGGRFDGPAVFAPGVPPGTYYVRVRALNDLGASGYSAETTVVVP